MDSAYTGDAAKPIHYTLLLPDASYLVTGETVAALHTAERQGLESFKFEHSCCGETARAEIKVAELLAVVRHERGLERESAGLEIAFQRDENALRRTCDDISLSL